MVLVLCVAVTLLEVAVCLGIERTVPAAWRRVISGSPLWSWVVGGFHQILVFPACTALALWPVGSGRLDFSTWMFASFSDGSAPVGCKWMHVVLIAYFAKDCLAVKCSAVIWAHHIVSIVAVLACYNGFLPQGAGVLTLGATVLELGGFANSVCEVQPEHRSLAVRRALTPAMTASNTVATGILVSFAWAFEGTARTRLLWWTTAAIGTGLSAVRQHEWNGKLQATPTAMSKQRLDD